MTLAPSNFFTPAKKRYVNINTIRVNLLHLAYMLGQREMYEKANEIAAMNMELINNSLIGKAEEFYLC